ncbi:MAG: prepilin-type N-terminal cleavage/methylation domain-containing protein [Elusimicrobiaceae bacterium]|nr:prepilin-type N-terminal cleavage/methylation domain-containing protein [Elusimicrobiaceae bacterium]
MKRGFTLIELLIVMVIVAVLVTVALPKYNAALERARAREGIANIKAGIDVLNTRYVMNGNMYTENGGGVLDSHGNFLTGNFMKPKYFTAPKATRKTDGSIQGWSAVLGEMFTRWRFEVSVIRKEGNEEVYSLDSLAMKGGMWPDIRCIPRGTNDGSVCEAAGFEPANCYQDDIDAGLCTPQDYIMHLK